MFHLVKNRQKGLIDKHSATLKLTSSRRSVSWGAARKTGREKIKKKRARGSDPRAFFIFSRPVFRAAPQLTERLEEATLKLNVGN